MRRQQRRSGSTRRGWLVALALALVIAAALLIAAGAGRGGFGRGLARRAQGLPAPIPEDAIPEVSVCPAALSAGAPSGVAVPILMYHYIRVDSNPRDPLGKGLSVTPTDFEAQMAWLHAHGAHTVTLAAIRESLAGRAPLPSNPVVLTFDDGHTDFLTRAVPVLERYGFTATVFAVSGFAGHPSYLSIAQLQQVAEAGMVIGAHTVDHPDLTTLARPRAASEISDSRTALRIWTGQAVEDFAYPSGRHNAAVEGQVAAAGFKDAVTTAIGVEHSLGDVFAWSRVRVAGGETLAGFARSLRIGLSVEPGPSCATPSPSPSDAGRGVT